MSEKEKETVRVRRRRRTSSGERQQAEAPRRRRASRPSQPPSSPRPPGGTGNTGGGGPSMSLPGGGSPLVIGVLILVFLCAAGAFFIFGGGLTGEAPASIPQTVSVGEQPVAAPQEQLVTPVAAPAEDIQLALPQDVGPNDTWLVMLYQDADDKILERDIFLDLNEAERIGSTDNVHIVAQVDRYRGGYSGDGNWTSAKRFYVTQVDLALCQHLTNSSRLLDLYRRAKRRR